MALACGAETLMCVGCTRWAWRRCTYVGEYDSATWPPASLDDFSPVPRLARLILAVYDPPPKEVDPLTPSDDPSLRPNPDWIFRRTSYRDTLGRCPPYLIYADHLHKELILAVRGLNLVKESDYRILLDNRLGKQMFDGGYVHHGLLEAATWLLEREWEFIKEKMGELGEGEEEEWRLVLVGHSLGSGVAALAAVLVVNRLREEGGTVMDRARVRCYALAPARCMSLNLAVKYADVIHSIVLQDDFLPRTATPLEHIFGSVLCLPCLLFLICLRDTFIPESRKLRDPRRLYAPGRMYHIVERKFCRCGRFPPQVRSAIPVEGRFEHIVLSCNTTSDHAIIWIEREARKALERMKEEMEPTMTAPSLQKMERMQTMQREHKEALVKAVSLNIPRPVAPTDETTKTEGTDASIEETRGASSSEGQSRKVNHWNELVEKLFDRSKSGKITLKEAETIK